MILYLDTSAVVKLYVTEAGSGAIRRAIATADEAATSLVAYVETRSAFARKHRLRQIADSEFEQFKRELDADWQHYTQLPVDPALVRIAGELAERFGLKGYDAIHLATADRLWHETHSAVAFAAFDTVLNRAASILGLTAVVPLAD